MTSTPGAVVAADTLVPWADQVLRQTPPSVSKTATSTNERFFTADASLNRTLALWRGPIWCLRADAIVNATSESLRDASGASGRLLRAAGDQMAVECAAAAPCRTAEAVVTRGCELPARFVIHTVGPKYSARYHTAAEHALHSCYRSVLLAAKERSLRSLAVGCVYSPSKGYPREEAAHIAARTVRRFLEHFGKDFDRVVFVVDSQEDEGIYESVLPLYFPRSDGEETRSSVALAGRDLGDEFGEPIIPERKIRIGALFRLDNGDDSNNQADDALSDEDGEDADEATRQFRAMTIDPDAERLEHLRVAQEERQRRALLATAEADRQKRKDVAARLHSALTGGGHSSSHETSTSSEDDFQDLRALEFLYVGGVDLSGAPVLVYIASKLPLAQDLHRVELFVLHTLQSTATRSSAGIGSTGHYSVLYVHDAPGVTSSVGETAGSQSTAAAAWFSRLMAVCGADKARHQAKLRYFYMLAPSMWLKLLVLVAKRSVGSAFYAKIVYLSASSALDNVAPELRLPPGLYTKKLEPKPADQPRDEGGDNQDHARSGSAFEGSAGFVGNNNSEDVAEEEEEAVV